MPITVLGSTDARVGRVQSELGALLGSFEGTITEAPSFAGRMLSTLGGINSSLRGQFGVPAGRDGNIEIALGGLDANLQSGGSVITTFSLTSTSTATLPFYLGHGFKKGDIPGGQDIVSQTSGVTLRAVVKRRWNDGSVKHAVLVGSSSQTSGVAKAITLKTGVASNGSSLTSASIQAAAPTASVQCGSIGTVSLSSLLATPFRTWISTPECVECHYRSQVGSDTNLVVWFYVRLFSGGRVHVRAAVENGYLGTESSAVGTKTYTATVVIGGTTVHNASVSHYAHTRWDRDRWIGGDPGMVPAHDVQYPIDTKLVPNYWKRSPTAGTLNGLVQTYAPMQLSPHPTAGGSAGFGEHIGPLPIWDALYVTTADSRAYNAVIAASRALGTYSVFRRWSGTNRIAKPTDGGTYVIDNGTFAIPNSAGIIEYNHLQNTGFLAYLITGEFFHWETMAALSSVGYYIRHGSGTGKVWTGETRGVGEMLRQVGHMAAISPTEGMETDDLAVVTEFRAWTAAQGTHWAGRIDAPGQNQLGTLFQNAIGVWGADGIPADGTVAPWMQNYWVGAMGQVSNMEPLADMTDWNTARDWMYRWPVGLGGTVGATNYCFTRAGSAYGLVVGAGVEFSPDETEFFDDWGAVWEASYGSENTSCVAGSALSSNPGDSHDVARAATNHRWSVFMQALSYAVEHGATGADAAWARFTGASNFPALEAGSASPNNFNDTPIWGIVPRDAVALPYSLPTSGNAVAIGTNTSQSVYPSSSNWSTESWNYSTFGSYGGNAFDPDYSAHGAYVAAGTGGHGHPDNVGALVFDFSTATWTRFDNDNGVALLTGAPHSFESGDTTGSPWYEVTGSNVPAPAHPYANMVFLPRGTKGSVAYITRAAVTGLAHNTGVNHRFDLATRLWSRLGSTGSARAGVEGDSVFDEARNRYWLVREAQHNHKNVEYFDLDDDTWKTSTSSDNFPSSAASGPHRVMLHDGYLVRNAGSSGLWLYDPDSPNNPTTGWLQLTVSGSLPDTDNRWARYSNGNWYSIPDSGGNTLTRIVPPADAKNGTWTVSTINISGASLPAKGGGASGATQTHHYTNFFYVPALDCLAWVPGDNKSVYLMKPGS